MPSRLISGPAGAGKSEVARERRRENSGPTVIADFQSIYAAIAGDTRGPDGNYPMRDPALLPMAEYVRRAVITGARNREIDVIVTNSDGDPGRRSFLLGELGEDAVEEIVDPGEDVVKARLSSRRTGRLSGACRNAIDRWYGRLR
jgi:hypothetical protein